MELEFLWFILSSLAGHPLSDSSPRPIGSLHRSSTAPISSSLSSPNLLQPYGQIISSCTEPDTIALTFDDGPFVYTRELARYLVENDVRATFFMTGHTWSNLDDEETADVVREVVGLGHQIGSHTYVFLISIFISFACLSQKETASSGQLVMRRPSLCAPPIKSSPRTIAKEVL